MTKWESNPELVPEECICAEDLDWDRFDTMESPSGANFGEEQASLGLDRFSVGYDLPLPTTVSGVNGDTVNAVPGQGENTLQDIGGPVLDDFMAGMPDVPEGMEGSSEINGASPSEPGTDSKSEQSENVAGPVP